MYTNKHISIPFSSLVIGLFLFSQLSTGYFLIHIFELIIDEEILDN